MQYRQLAQFQVSEVGLGCASYWGKKQFSEQQATAVVAAALDAGINYLDTGASYSGGHAEPRLGRILKHQSNKNQLIISSKVGTEVGHFGRLYKDFRPASIRASCERSLKRLGVDYLSVFFLHGPNIEDFNEKTYQVLADLKQAGKVGLVGVNTFNSHIIECARESRQFELLMTDFNLFKPKQVKTLKSCRESGMDVVIAGALGGALYSKNWRRINGIKSLWYHLRALKNNRQQLKAAKNFAFLNEDNKFSATQLALAYVLHCPYHSSALVGTTSASHIRQLADVSGKPISESCLAEIHQAQLNINVS